jgi:Domain of unknown function (DUF4160)
MPRISSFYGIVIEMYFRDHPPPHFHALYAGEKAKIDIATGEVLRGLSFASDTAVGPRMVGAAPFGVGAKLRPGRK